MIHLILYDQFCDDPPRNMILEGPDFDVKREYEIYLIAHLGAAPFWNEGFTFEQKEQYVRDYELWKARKKQLKWEDFFNYLVGKGYKVVEFKEQYV